MEPAAKRVSETEPWLMPEVIEWLGSIVKKTDVVLETGAGGSTVFFAERAARVITYEHDGQWMDAVTRRLVQKGLNRNVEWRYRMHYSRVGLGPLPSIDLAFIDGRGRVRSVIDAAPKLRPGGWLILDDSNRERYEEARRVMEAEAVTSIVFRSGLDETTAWRKRA